MSLFRERETAAEMEAGQERKKTMYYRRQGISKWRAEACKINKEQGARYRT